MKPSPMVLLLNPPGEKLYIRDYYCSFSSKANYYWPPQDLLALSGLIGQAFPLAAIDAIIEGLNPEEVERTVLKQEFQAVVFTTGTATLAADLALMARLKEQKPRIKIVASAGILKFIGQELLRRHPFLDAALLDFTEPGIISYLQGEANHPLPGLVYRQNGRLIASADRPPLEFSYPVPRHELFPFKRYRLPIARRFPFTVVVTSLGCPFHCAFCTAGAFGYRQRRLSNVIEELRYLKQLGVKEILFQDPTFTINTKRVVDLCQQMITEGLDFTWSCNAELKSLNEEKVAWMKQAGCHTVSVGIESGDEVILKQYSKPIGAREVQDKIRLAKKYNLKVLGYFIIGLPGETKESIERTIRLAKSLPLDLASFAIATPDVGTRLRQEAIARGLISPDLLTFDSTEFPVFESPELQREEIWSLRQKANREFYLRPSYIFKRLKEIRTFRDLKLSISNALSLFRK
ncbi:MAG: B12-binding domain-containing radical SAM protein [Candidatus Aminicenantales bacterium]